MSIVDAQGNSPLHYACEANTSDVAKFLMENGHKVRVYNKYNGKFPGSSERIGRALFLFEPPDIDSNEITDKGYINQSAVLSSRSGLVDRLYSNDETAIIFK